MMTIEKQTVEVNQLGLAAYLKMKGARLMEVRGKVFRFETDKPLSQWRVDYNNSCCMQHDTLVCELRHHLKG